MGLKEKLHQMQEEGIDPFPTQAKQTHTSQEAIDATIEWFESKGLGTGQTKYRHNSLLQSR